MARPVSLHLLVAASLVLAPAQSVGGPVSLTATVERGLDDSGHSLERMARLAGALPSMLHVVASGETFSGILLARYGVSRGSPSAASYLPRSYAWLAEEVARRTGLRDVGALQVGDTLWLPTLPPRSRTDPGSGNQANQSPLAMRLPMLPATRETATCKAWPAHVRFGPPRLDSVPGSRASQVAELTFSVPPGLADCARRALEEAPRIGPLVAASHVPIELPDQEAKGPEEGSARYQPPDPFTLSPTLKAALTRRLTRDKGTRVSLLVLDTGWPSREARDASYAALREMLAWFDSAFALGADLSRSPSSYPFRAPTQRHVLGIEEALRPLEALDYQDRVQVVYLPLTVDQPGSEVVIRQLLYIHEAFEAWRNRSLTDRFGAPVLSTADRSRIRDEVDRITRRIPSSLAKGQITTHSRLVDAVRYLSGQYAYRTGTAPFLLNLSWTAPAQSITLTEGKGVLTVAAAGNDGKDVLHERTPPLDFAARSTGGENEYLTVFVLDPGTGLNRCSSAHFRRTPSFEAEGLFAVGFNGMVPGHGCFTSWASPRVAWLIAARWGVESLERRAALTPDQFIYLLQKTLNGLRGDSAEPKNFVLDPVAFLEGSS